MLKEIINRKDLGGSISRILNRLHTFGPIYPEDMEKLSYMKKFHPKFLAKYERNLMYLIGLFYKTTTPKSLTEVVYSHYSNLIWEETGRNFTPVQASAYKNISEKKYFSFSAPTSSGKSHLFRELIKSANGDIIIVVPSRALIAEYIHVIYQLVDKTVLVLQFIENVNTLNIKRRIYIVTPERGEEIFKLIDVLNIELFLFDEAQISEDISRGIRFDSYVRRVDRFFPHAKKVFTHPFIQNPEAQLQKHNFLVDSSSVRYDQNTVGKIYLSLSGEKLHYFSPFALKRDMEMIAEELDLVESILKKRGTLLVYISKSRIYDGSYISDFSKYINLCPKLTERGAVAIINELREFIGASEYGEEKHSVMIDMMEKGIVVHHGSMPLKARLLIENFVNANYARICFATSTLAQGINMPFDAVWINNFRFPGSKDQKNLDLKNLIGRAGRSTKIVNSFDFGYVIVENKNLKTFCTRMLEFSILKETSALEDDLTLIPEDLKDIAEAIKDNSFNNDLQLTLKQIERINNSNIHNDIILILDSLLHDHKPIKGNEYYKIPNETRKLIKQSFQNIFKSHLRRAELNKAEQATLAASIPILLWHIQGRSFKEIVSLRYGFLSQIGKQRAILTKLKNNEINESQALKEKGNLLIKASPLPISLPKSDAKLAFLFKKNTSVLSMDYDILVYDTYDYLDKVISFSLKDPLKAAFHLFFLDTGDSRALAMKNYIEYSTNDPIEIWLIKYGFTFEEIDWIKNYVESIDEKEIRFTEKVELLDDAKRKSIERFL